MITSIHRVQTSAKEYVLVLNVKLIHYVEISLIRLITKRISITGLTVTPSEQ